MLPGTSELLIIFAVALLIFGPSKLPKLGGALGEGIRNFKGGLNGTENKQSSGESTPSKKTIP
ncbi:MAG: twin-arginine translocase TatA/TatE family subunit [Zetaproteobacteria bacterium]|nr:twin-arginine translocase TatA/TatE family subunit [Zetaproteobacteria bacterium]